MHGETVEYLGGLCVHASQLRDTVEEFLTPTEQKVALVCGDFNINLLRSPRLQPLDLSTGRRPVLSEPIMFLPYFTVAAAAAVGGGQDGLSARRWEEPQLPEDGRTLPMFCWMCRRVTGA